MQTKEQLVDEIFENLNTSKEEYTETTIQTRIRQREWPNIYRLLKKEGIEPINGIDTSFYNAVRTNLIIFTSLDKKEIEKKINELKIEKPEDIFLVNEFFENESFVKWGYFKEYVVKNLVYYLRKDIYFRESLEEEVTKKLNIPYFHVKIDYNPNSTHIIISVNFLKPYYYICILDKIAIKEYLSYKDNPFEGDIMFTEGVTMSSIDKLNEDIQNSIKKLQEIDKQHTFGWGEPDVVEAKYKTDTTPWEEMSEIDKRDFISKLDKDINEEIENTSAPPVAAYYEDDFESFMDMDDRKEDILDTIMSDRFITNDVCSELGIDEDEARLILDENYDEVKNIDVQTTLDDVPIANIVLFSYIEDPNEHMSGDEWIELSDDIFERLEIIPEDDAIDILNNVSRPQGVYDIEWNKNTLGEYMFSYDSVEVYYSIDPSSIEAILHEHAGKGPKPSPFEGDPMFATEDVAPEESQSEKEQNIEEKYINSIMSKKSKGDIMTINEDIQKSIKKLQEIDTQHIFGWGEPNTVKIEEYPMTKEERDAMTPEMWEEIADDLEEKIRKIVEDWNETYDENFFSDSLLEQFDDRDLAWGDILDDGDDQRELAELLDQQGESIDEYKDDIKDLTTIDVTTNQYGSYTNEAVLAEYSIEEDQLDIDENNFNMGDMYNLCKKVYRLPKEVQQSLIGNLSDIMKFGHGHENNIGSISNKYISITLHPYIYAYLIVNKESVYNMMKSKTGEVPTISPFAGDKMFDMGDSIDSEENKEEDIDTNEE